MVVDKFEDLDAWQVADELRLEVYALTATGAASQDFKLCSQLRDAASSATRNISEGFGRFYPGDFALFMDFSIASVMEIQDCLRDGMARKHFTTDRAGKAHSLTVRSLQVSKGLKRYLQSARRHPRWHSRRTSNDRTAERTTNDSGRSTERTPNDTK
jgi:four helix bundle protein